MEQQDKPDRELLGLLELYKYQPLLNLQDKETVDAIQLHLSHPMVQDYFRVLANNAVIEVFRNELKHPDDKDKLVYFFSRVKGVISVCDMIIQTFGKGR